MKFLSESQIYSYFGHVAATEDQLSLYARSCWNPVAGRSTPDFAGLVTIGVDTLFSPMAQHQPKAHKALMERMPKLLIGETAFMGLDKVKLWVADAFVGSGERFVRVAPYWRGDAASSAGSRFHYRYASLPPAVAEAYYGLTCGMEVLQQLPGNPMLSRVLPARIDVWGARGDSLCGPGRKAQAAMKAGLTAIADPAAPPRKDGLVWKSFACVLDTREQQPFNAEGDRERDAIGTTGDLLFVQEHSLSRRIFHVHDGDFTAIRLVRDPVRLYDEYVAWVFNGGEGRFDFCAYSRAI